MVSEEEVLAGAEGIEDGACSEEELVLAADDSAADASSGAVALQSPAGLLLDPIIAVARNTFCEGHCHAFQALPDSQQRELFEAYKAALQVALQQALQRQAPAAHGGSPVSAPSLQELVARAHAQQQELDEQEDEELLELLASVQDFGAFVALLADYAQDAGDAEGGGLQLQGSKVALHAEEQEDGEARPDLDAGLTVSGVCLTAANNLAA